MTTRFFISKTMNKTLYYILIFIAGLLFSSCEKGKDTFLDTNLNSPFLYSSSLAVGSINLDDTTTNGHLTKLPNSEFTITDTVTVFASNPNGLQDIKQVRYRIYSPGAASSFSSGTLLLAFGKSSDTASTGYRAAFTFTLSRSDIGLYTIETYAVGNSGQISNYVQVPLLISRNNSRPRTLNIIAPDTIVRPTSGTELIKLSIAVTDSDGYGDINQVFFKRISPPSAFLFSLYDDGDKQIHGDQLAGDGTFSRIISIDQTAIIGDQLFVFLARDKSGAISDSLFHTITIQ